MKALLNGKLILSFCLLFANPIFSESTWQNGYINLKDGYQINAEYSHETGGNYYLRQGKNGHVIDKNKVISIVDKEYVELISNSSPTRSLIESVFYFQSGSTYTNISYESKKKNDLWAFGIKSVSFASMAFFFSEAISSQRRVQNSTYLLDYDKSRAKFLNARENFTYSIALFFFITAYYAIDAYVNFDTDSIGEKTNTFKAKEIRLEEYLRLQYPESKSGINFEKNIPTLVSYEKSYNFNF
ncbi:hypothetical protein EHQ24_15730 [Leptospira noumeaensis]|uniref:Uncharacterized protein n=1 Tax=Leptospira noumeaensis TaxID=2484964 RepID=A0A4R9I121_9LEPT|nr:hypothetical protein [Leptospira noumeaensis]TGK78997.1 hypothetical protein EHQ24_15730 [Leptospira noumeaensis]